MFADGVDLLKPTPHPSCEFELQGDVNLISNFFSEKWLPLNTSKTKLVVFGRHQVPPALTQPILLGQDSIEVVPSFKYMGIWFDQKLNYNLHTETASKKAKRAVGSLNRKFNRVLPLFALENIRRFTIIPGLTYDIEIWWPKARYSQVKIEKVQRLMLRFLLNDHASTMRIFCNRAAGN